MKDLIDKVYDHPWMTTCIISALCTGIAEIVAAFRKD